MNKLTPQVEGNRLIAVFMGGELIEGRQGNVYWFGNYHYILTEHKALNVHDFKYHSSWDWQIPAWSKVVKLNNALCMDAAKAEVHNSLCDQYQSAVCDNKPNEGFEILVQAIEWYNSQKP